jgi:hypothetical protein
VRESICKVIKAGIYNACGRECKILCPGYCRNITPQGSFKTLSKNYGTRLTQGHLQGLKALDPDLQKPDFEAPDPRNLKNQAKTNMYRFGPKKMKRANDLCKMPSRARAAQDPGEINVSDKTL